MGQITKVGWGKEPVGFSIDPLVQKAVTLQGSFSHTFKTWERVIGLMAGGKLNLAPMRRVFSLDDWDNAFKTMDKSARDCEKCAYAVMWDRYWVFGRSAHRFLSPGSPTHNLLLTISPPTQQLPQTS